MYHQMKRLRRLVFQGKTKDFWLETQQSVINHIFQYLSYKYIYIFIYIYISNWSGLVSRHDFIHFLSSGAGLFPTNAPIIQISQLTQKLEQFFVSYMRLGICREELEKFWAHQEKTSPMKSTKARFSLRWPAPNRTLAGVALPGGAVCTCGCQRLKRFRATFGETSQLESPKTVLA